LRAASAVNRKTGGIRERLKCRVEARLAEYRRMDATGVLAQLVVCGIHLDDPGSTRWCEVASKLARKREQTPLCAVMQVPLES
jgi:hypothetical protein